MMPASSCVKVLDPRPCYLKLSFRRAENTKLQETEEKIKEVRDKEGKEIENTTIWC